LSTSDTFTTANAIVLDTVGHSGILEPAAQYTVNREVTIPNGLNGTYHVYVWTDYADQVFEYNANTNNVASGTPVSIQLTPSPDLRSQEVTILTQGSVPAGQPVEVQ